MLLDHLAQAERHVLQGERCVARQQELVAQLAGGGHDTTQARLLLAQFQELQTMHITDRDRLLWELQE